MLIGCPRPQPQLDRVLLVSPDPPYTTDAWQEDRLMLSLTARDAVTTRLGINSQLKAVVGYVDARWDGLTWVYWGGASAVDADGHWRLLGSAALRSGRTEGPDTLTVEELATGLSGPVLVVLDSCAGGGDRGVGVHLSGGREAKPLQLPDGVLVWSAAAPDGRCYTAEPGMGLFTSLVVQALDGAANDGGADGDSVITLSEASAWVRAQALERSVGAQSPMLYGDPSFLEAPLARHRGVPIGLVWGDTPRFLAVRKTSAERREALQMLERRVAAFLARPEHADYELEGLRDALWAFRFGANDEASVRALILAVQLNAQTVRHAIGAPPLSLGYDEATMWCYAAEDRAWVSRDARDTAFSEASRLSAPSWDALRADVDASWQVLPDNDLEGCLAAANKRAVGGSDAAASELEAAMRRLRALPETCVSPQTVGDLIALSEDAARFSDPVHIARIARSLEDWATMWESRCSQPED